MKKLLLLLFLVPLALHALEDSETIVQIKQGIEPHIVSKRMGLWDKLRSIPTINSVVNMTKEPQQTVINNQTYTINPGKTIRIGDTVTSPYIIFTNKQTKQTTRAVILGKKSKVDIVIDNRGAHTL